jgi:hypothetical protein
MPFLCEKYFGPHLFCQYCIGVVRRRFGFDLFLALIEREYGLRSFISSATQLSLGADLYTCENVKGLVPAEHRIRMCELAVADSPFIMVDSWEVSLAEYLLLVACQFQVCLLYCYLYRSPKLTCWGGVA